MTPPTPIRRARRSGFANESTVPQTVVWLTPPEMLAALGPFDITGDRSRGAIPAPICLVASGDEAVKRLTSGRLQGTYASWEDRPSGAAA